jgi:hypothetical protein
MKISFDQITILDASRYEIEASALGFKPGVWPDRIETDMGNGLPLIRHRNPRVQAETNEVVGFTYFQSQGVITVFVVND